jgi:hypothetical protein
MLSGLSVHFSDKDEMAKLLGTVNVILARHGNDIEVMCLASSVYIAAAR